MSNTDFYWVDAFTDQPFAGNPAGVCLPQRAIAEDQMQRIAKEINLSETAFAVPSGDNRFHLRWFTPTTEVELCGHATLATAKALWHNNPLLADTIEFQTLSGPLYVTRIEEQLQMDFPLIPTHSCATPEAIKNAFPSAIGCASFRKDLLVELETPEDVEHWEFDRDLVLGLDCRVLVITAAANSFDFVSRVFVPKEGIDEDPVTGSVHCALADYWCKKTHRSEFTAKQVSARGGILKLKIVEQRVKIVGQAIIILKGELKI